MNVLIVALALQAAQPGESPPPGDASPILPFETGELVMRMAMRANGRVECAGSGRGPGFEAIATRFCGGMNGPTASLPANDEVLRRFTMTIAIAREGETLPAIEGEGDRVYDAEVEIEVNGDGKATACRALREEHSSAAGSPFLRGGGICAEMMSDRQAFLPAQEGGGLRRGRLRMVHFLEGEAEAAPPR
jgi:hypothetical protein